MKSELLPTDTEDDKVVDRANNIMEFIRRTSNPLGYIKSTIVAQNKKENEYTELVTTSRAKQLELTEKYYLLSEKYSDLMDKYITLKEQT